MPVDICRHSRSYGARIGLDVGDPYRLAVAGQPIGHISQRTDDRLPTAADTRRDRPRGRRAPAAAPTQVTLLHVQAPEGARRPILELTDGVHDDLQSLRHAVGLREDARDRVLEVLQLLRAHRGTDVVRNAAVAAESELVVEDRLTAEANEAHHPTRIAQRQNQIAERLAFRKHRGLRTPIGIADGPGAELEHGLADELGETTGGVRLPAGLAHGETQVFV